MSGDGVRGDRPPRVPEPSAAGPARLRSPRGARLDPRAFTRLVCLPGGDSGGVCSCQGVPAPGSPPIPALAGPCLVRSAPSQDVAGFGGVGLTGLFCVPRLWHQLTLQVLDFVQDPCFAQGDGLIKVSRLFLSFSVFLYHEKLSLWFLSFLILLENC